MRFALVLISAVAFAGERPDPPIVELARSAPPELFADAIIRAVQSGKIADRDRQIELLNDAFSAAARAKETIRLVAIPGTPPDTREIYRSKAGDLGLDALTLQSRIVQSMARLDPVRARELFNGIARPKLDPRPCVDPLIADASAYYDAAAAIAQYGFTAREKETDLHIEFLNALLVTARSPNEIAAFAHALQFMALSTEQSKYLLSSIDVKMELAPPDYRPFAMSLDTLQAELWKLVEINRSAREQTIRSFRAYIENQLKAERCLPELSLGLDQISWLQPPVAVDELRSAQLYETFRPHKYFEDDDSKRIGEALNRLRAKPAAISDFLRDFDAWKPAGSDVDIFHQRATVLRALLEIVPRGDERNRVIAIAAALLTGGMERAYPAEWMWETQATIDAASADRAALLEALKSSVSAQLYFGISSGTSK